MFAFVPTSPITNKKRNEISDQYLNHVNNIIFGLKKKTKKKVFFEPGPSKNNIVKTQQGIKKPFASDVIVSIKHKQKNVEIHSI